MIYLLYVIVAAFLIFLSVKASDYVDLIDKKTALSGAFIGGVMLSAVTSLPELFTSISSTLLLDQPGLCMGNILGSDLFNLMVLGVAMLVCYRSFGQAKIMKSHGTVTLMVFVIYLALLLNMFGYLNLEIFTISVTSIFIIIFYVLGVKNMAGDSKESSDEGTTSLTIKQIVFRFILASIGIIGLSIGLTYITDIINDRLHLGQGLAGALFLGICTSLPEVSATIALFKKKNYNIAIGNMIGSNIFNFMILAVTDIIYVGGGLYDFSDPKTVNLLIFGAIATLSTLILLMKKNKVTALICPLIAALSYVAFLCL